MQSVLSVAPLSLRCVATHLVTLRFARLLFFVPRHYGTRHNVTTHRSCSRHVVGAPSAHYAVVWLVLPVRLQNSICVKSSAVLAIRQAYTPRISLRVVALPRSSASAPRYASGVSTPRPAASAILRCRSDDGNPTDFLDAIPTAFPHWVETER